MNHELRCNKLHGILVEGTTLVEIACKSRLCGAGPGVVVLHRFDVAQQGRLVSTKMYKNPGRNTIQ